MYNYYPYYGWSYHPKQMNEGNQRQQIRRLPLDPDIFIAEELGHGVTRYVSSESQPLPNSEVLEVLVPGRFSETAISAGWSYYPPGEFSKVINYGMAPMEGNSHIMKIYVHNISGDVAYVKFWVVTKKNVERVFK